MNPRTLWGFGATALLLLGALVASTFVSHVVAAERAPRIADLEALDAIARENGNPTARIVASENALADAPAEDRALVVAAGVAPGAPEIAAIDDFVTRGGRVIVIAEPALAAHFDAPLSQSLVSGADGRPGVAVETRLANAPHELRLPGSRAVLRARQGLEPLLETATDTFLDADGDGRAGAGDVSGPFAVTATTDDGRVLIVASDAFADPAWLATGDGHATARALLARAIPSGVTIVFDDRHASSVGAVPSAAYATGIDLARVPALRASAIALVGAGATFFAAGTVLARRRDARQDRSNGLDAPVRLADIEEEAA